MTYISAAHQQCVERVDALLQAGYARHVIRRAPEIFRWTLLSGETVIHLTIAPWHHDALVDVNAWIVRGPRLDDELLEFLLERNTRVLFGALGLDRDGDVVLRHAILGSTCDSGALRMTLTAIASLGDDLGREISARWGGMTALTHAQQSKARGQ